MSDFIREVDEEYRQDQFRRFLSRYWIALLLLAVAILAAAGGWRAYQYVRQQRAEAAGARYFDAVNAYAADPKASLAGLDALAQDGPAGYRTLARFRAAGELGRTDVPGAVRPSTPSRPTAPCRRNCATSRRCGPASWMSTPPTRPS